MMRYKKANQIIHAPEGARERAARPAGKRGRGRWTGAVAAALAVALIGGGAAWFGLPGNGPGAGPAASPTRRVQGRALSLALARYPEMAPYPRHEDYFDNIGDGEGAWQKANDAYSKAWADWRADMTALRSDTDYTGLLDGFLSASAQQFLTGAGTDNRVYSPLNVYMALSMLAETAGGDSRAQILDLLQVDSIESLRARAAALWRDHYRDDGAATSLLANSLWLRDGMTYRQETLDTLARDYYASSFSGEMGSEEYDQALRDWLNQQTRGLLEEQANGLSMDPDTALALASAVYFKAAWASEFDKASTERDVFHAPGGDVDAGFMRRSMTATYWWGEHFSAVRLLFQEGGAMWLILPDEGHTVDQLAGSGEAMDFLLADKYGHYDEEKGEYVEFWLNRKDLTVNLSMPRFDVSSDLDLIGGLKELGVTDVFDSRADFDPLGASTDYPLYVYKAQHAARVKVDEEGCEAAAYTVIMEEPQSAPFMPEDEVDFILDRPFLFAVTGDSGLPLFLGAVNQPNG